MNTRLKHVENWAALAGKSNWSAGKLAKMCGVSLRTLQRHFQAKIGTSPKIWLSEQRQCEARRLIVEGISVKETAWILGYRHAYNFSRGFKKQWGRSPTEPERQNTIQ